MLIEQVIHLAVILHMIEMTAGRERGGVKEMVVVVVGISIC